MKNKIITSVILSFLVINVGCGKDPINPTPPEPIPTIKPPGVVVNHSKKESRVFLGSPSILVLTNGDYLISHDESGPGTVGFPNITRVFKSSDKGLTWELISSITDTGQTWSNIFEYQGAQYIMGTQGPIMPCQIRKSIDNGKTWSTPTNTNNGLLMNWRCHTSAVPMVEYNNRIWRGMEVKNPNLDGWPKQYNAMIMSAPIGSDLMIASNWTKSNQLEYNNTYLNGNFGGWLEGNAVLDKNGGVKLLMRVEVPGSTDEVIAIIDVSKDGKTISFDPATGFVKMPGGAKKFTIRYDPSSGKYLTLSNYVDPSLRYMNPGYVRNKLAFCSSFDMRNWEVDAIILEDDDVKYVGFQYVDWLIEGNDIVFASRTAYDDDFGGADSYHNSNYITFHRVTDYKSKIKTKTSTNVPYADYSKVTLHKSNNKVLLDNLYSNSRVKVFNINGQIIFDTIVTTPNFSISLNKGTYVVDVNGSFTKKVLIN